MTSGASPFGQPGPGPAAPHGVSGQPWSPFGPPAGGDPVAAFGGPSGATADGGRTGPPGFRGDSGTGFDGPLPLPALQVGAPPLLWLGLAGASGAGGLALAVLSAPAAVGALPTGALLAWILAGPVAIGLLAIFLTKDTALRARSFYSAPRWLPFAYRAVLLLSVLAVVISAFRIADWAGRL